MKTANFEKLISRPYIDINQRIGDYQLFWTSVGSYPVISIRKWKRENEKEYLSKCSFISFPSITQRMLERNNVLWGDGEKLLKILGYKIN